jgi:hypothetical protein
VARTLSRALDFQRKIAVAKILKLEAKFFLGNFSKLTVAKFRCKSAAGVRCRAGIAFHSFRGKFAVPHQIGAKQGK